MDPERLLEDLCVRLGFCLHPADRGQLIESPPQSVDAFTDEIIRREGLDPVTFDSTVRAQVRAVVAEHMGQPLGPPRRSRNRG